MNKRQVVILWIIAIVLGLSVAALKLTRKSSDQSATQRAPGQTLLESFPATDVATVEIQGAKDSVTLEKKDGKWTVSQRDSYPANSSYVNDFIRTLDDLKVTRGMEAGESFAPRFGMDESSSNPDERGLTATLKSATGSEIATVSLGKNIESNQGTSPMGGGSVGRYVRNHADPSGFYAVSEMFPSVSSEPARWLDDDFISVEKVQSISLSEKGSDKPAWTITRETEDAEFKLEGAAADETLDTAAGAPLKSILSYARFEDVIPSDQVAGRADESGTRTAVLKTFEGFTYTLKITPDKSASITPPPASIANPQSPPPTDNLLLTVTVEADLPKERKKEEGEKPEDAKAKDTAFADRIKTLNDKLETAKSFTGRTYEVSNSTLAPLLKERGELVTKATPPPASDPATGSVQQHPGGIIATPPVQATPPTQSQPTRRIEAVTPPIAVPPLEQDAETPKDPAGQDDKGEDQ